VAECLTESVVTPGDDWDELRANVKDAVQIIFAAALIAMEVDIALPL